jgi:hypothetical protein
MGCLNDEGKFDHWFGNIHLSGPCNRACYFCIGQHMMALDAENVLDTWPLPNIDKFLQDCYLRNVGDIFVTGTNTDPMLYRHTEQLVNYLKKSHGYYHPRVGVRTNGVGILSHPERWDPYDKASVTICSLNMSVNQKMMGGPALTEYELTRIFESKPDVKVNIVLGPENVYAGYDVFNTLRQLTLFGPRRVNLREPYGQPHVGNPLAHWTPAMYSKGMPTYKVENLEVTYWDVHYCEVESVNLYANGHISIDYPITKGHDPIAGIVKDQTNFPGGRVQMQWLGTNKKAA